MITELNDLNLLIGGFNPEISRALSKYSRELKIHYNSEVYKDIIDLYKESGVTVSSLRIVLERNKIAPSLIEHVSTLFQESKSLDSVSIELIKTGLKNIIESVLLKEAEIKARNPSEYTDLVKSINVVLDSTHELDKVMTSFSLSDVDLDTELQDLGDPIISPISGINALQSIGGYCKNQLISISASPGSGKSLMLIYHSLQFIKDGRKVVYFALGDLSVLDFCIRLVSMELKISMNEATKTIKESYKRFCNILGDKLNNLIIKLVDPGILTAHDIEKYCVDKGLDVPGNILIVDYDGNLKKEADNTYQEGIDQYNILKAMCSKGRFDLVMVASQVSRSAHNEPIIHANSLAESIGKLNIVDMLITIGKNPDAVNQIGYINLAKVRRGGMSSMFPYIRDLSGRFITISLPMYHALISETTLKLIKDNSQKVDEESLLKEVMNSFGDTKDSV